MAKLRVVIDVNETGDCVASMEFRKQELEAEGSSPSEALQSLAETLALHEEEDNEPVSEDLQSGHVYHFS